MRESVERDLAVAESRGAMASDRIKELEAQKAVLVAAVTRMEKMFQYIARGQAMQAQAEQGIIEAREVLSLVSS
jgi:hypothetical protein